MKGKDLIKLIKENKLENFDAKFVFTDGCNIFPNERSFNIVELGDIGYSSNIFQLEGEEE